MIYRIDIGITPTPSTPSAPQNLQATAGEGYVYLDWDTPSDDGGSTITEYKIYRGTGTAWTYLVLPEKFLFSAKQSAGQHFEFVPCVLFASLFISSSY
jgi:hypothetical protein